MRERYHLKGNLFSDMLCGCLLTPCMLVQQEREVEFREPGNVEKQEQYQAESPMLYPGKEDPAKQDAGKEDTGKQ